MVETVTAAEEKDGMWVRQVRIVWVAKDPWANYAPLIKDVIGDQFTFKNSNLISVNAPSITLNFNQLTKQ